MSLLPLRHTLPESLPGNCVGPIRLLLYESHVRCSPRRSLEIFFSSSIKVPQSVSEQVILALKFLTWAIFEVFTAMKIESAVF
jgi:hypothetical protein